MVNNQELNNYVSLTMLRGLACIAVCFMHFTGTTESDILVELGRYGFYGVPVFFAISGFVIPLSMHKSAYKLRSFFPYVLRRLVRLHPPYLFALLAVLLLSTIAQLSPYSSSGSIPWFSMDTLSHLFLITDFTTNKWMNPVFWTLAQELQFYILIGLIYPLIVHRSSFLKIGIVALACLLSYFIEDDRFIPFYFLYFMPGIILFWYVTRQLSNKLLFSLFVILCIVGFVKYGIIAPVCALTFSLFVLFIKVEWKPLVFLGTISYSLYLIHTPLGTDGIINFVQNFNLSAGAKIWLMVGVFPLVVFGAWIFYLCFEKPFVLFSKRIKY